MQLRSTSCRPLLILGLIASCVGPRTTSASAVHARDPAPLESAAQAQPRLVRVDLAGAPGRLLLRAGFDVLQIKGDGAWLLEWPGDGARLAALGLRVEVADPSPGRSTARRARAERDAAPPALRVAAGSAPAVGEGGMDGYWTLAEIGFKLDDLIADDVHGVVADRLDTLGFTWEGRPIRGLALGRVAAPAVYLDALSHAREPTGMYTLFHFVDDLLAGYGVDPFATYLLDHRRIYIVPVINPDGYAVNESLFVANGAFGFWRKNARDNDTSGVFNGEWDGVDLNRNCGLAWGHDDTGSTPDPRRETYRGPSAFSEPESQAQRDVVTALAPATALSFHAYGELVTHPWSYTGLAAGHESQFHAMSDAMVERSGYQSGQTPELLYLVNGAFIDWAYGDTLDKPRTMAWLPEVGTADDGFWPPPSRLAPIAEDNLRVCYLATAMAGPYLQADGVTVGGGAMNAGAGATVWIGTRNLGLAIAPAGLEVTMVPLDPGVQMMVATVSCPSPGTMERVEPGTPFEFTVDDSVTAGRLMRFEIVYTAPDGYFSSDTVRVPFGTGTVLAADDAMAGLGLWSPGLWGIVGGELAHPAPFFTDSPIGHYVSQASNVISLTAPFDLSAGVHAYATFSARWEVESAWDALYVEASSNGGAWIPLAGGGATHGTGIGVQIAGDPLYAGTRRGWAPERVDLSPFAGPGGGSVQLRLRLQSDLATTYDGFAFDSLRIEVFDPAAQPWALAVADPVTGLRLSLAAPSPNPARLRMRFEIVLPHAETARIEILDLQGRRARTLAGGALAAGAHAIAWDGRDDAGRRVAPGVYFARLASASGSVSRRFAVIE